MKGNGEVSWCDVNGISAGVQEIERVKDSVVVLMNDVRHNAVIDFGCLSYRILWVEFKFSRVKVCVVAVYGHSEGDLDSGMTWTGLWIQEIMGIDGCVMGDLNGWVGYRVRVHIHGAFGVHPHPQEEYIYTYTIMCVCERVYVLSLELRH